MKTRQLFGERAQKLLPVNIAAPTIPGFRLSTGSLGTAHRLSTALGGLDDYVDEASMNRSSNYRAAVLFLHSASFKQSARQ